MYGKHYLFSYFQNDVALITDKKFKKFGLVHISGKILAEPIYDEIKTESFYPYPNNITFGVHAYGTNLKAFTVPKIEKGFVTAIIKDKKNYSEQVSKIPVAQ
ncbi:MAG: hypothetical protein EOO07_33795 [Chitinophagaceae bacterium]|nr:MAG: hypothetical protein EOO07_33795 [Chitinophagaceae bacterium]